MGKGGGGAAPQPTTQTVQQTNLPPWAQPYSEAVMGKAQALTDINYNPYQPYGGQRLADFSPMQQQGFWNTANMQPSAATGYGMDIAADAANQARGMARYQPMQERSYYDAPWMGSQDIGYTSTQTPQLQQYQIDQVPQAQAAQTGYNPQLQQYQMGPAERVQAAQVGYNPQLQQYQMGPAQQVSTDTFTQPGKAASYMSPYMQNVVDVQQREAQRQADIARTGRQAQAVGAGAFGGSRQAIMDAEAARNLATQKGDIQAQGLQAAYQQGQQAYQTDAARQLQAQQANQQAGIATGQQNLAAALGVQQLGTQTGLQSALANQQAQQQAALANQQAGLTTGQQNLAAALGVQQLGTQTGLQTTLANQQAQQQAALANQQAALSTGQQNLAAALGVQQLGAQQGLQSQQLNQAAQLQAQQQALQQQQALNQAALQSAQLRAQYGLGGAQAAEQSRQYGAGLGLQGIQQQLAAAGQLGQLGGQQYAQQMGINQAMLQGGAQQQALQQQQLTNQYQDYLNQINYPYQQLGFMSDVLRGVPTGSGITTMQQYQAAPSLFGQIAGLGIGLGGLSQAFGTGRKAGGTIKAYKKGGAVKYAEGGIAALAGQNVDLADPTTELGVKSQLAASQKGQPTVVPLSTLLALQDQIKRLHTQPVAASQSPQQTTVAEELAMQVLGQQPPQADQAPQQVAQQAMQTPPMGHPPAAAPGGLPSLPAPNIGAQSFNAAGGGIVAFAGGGDTEDEDSSPRMRYGDYRMAGPRFDPDTPPAWIEPAARMARGLRDLILPQSGEQLSQLLTPEVRMPFVLNGSAASQAAPSPTAAQLRTGTTSFRGGVTTPAALSQLAAPAPTAAPASTGLKAPAAPKANPMEADILGSLKKYVTSPGTIDVDKSTNEFRDQVEKLAPSRRDEIREFYKAEGAKINQEADRDRWLGLAMGGFTMVSLKSPDALQSFGEGMGLATKEISLVNKELRAADAARKKAERAEIAADRAEQLGKFKLVEDHRDKQQKFLREEADSKRAAGNVLLDHYLGKERIQATREGVAATREATRAYKEAALQSQTSDRFGRMVAAEKAALMKNKPISVLTDPAAAEAWEAEVDRKALLNVINRNPEFARQAGANMNAATGPTTSIDLSKWGKPSVIGGR